MYEHQESITPSNIFFVYRRTSNS